MQKKYIEKNSILENKYLYINCKDNRRKLKKLKKYYKSFYPRRYARYKILHLAGNMSRLKIDNKIISFIRWILVDTLRGKTRRKFGIYQFVALPGQGKTMSMVAHMERYRKKMQGNCYIATNFNYKYQNSAINHWTDMIKISKDCYRLNIPCLIAMDEIHITFDSTEWQKFPAEMLAMLSFNRKYQLEFLCSAQIYERIPAKIRNIANFTVICKNVGNFDRYFIDYYFAKDDYEKQFEGKKQKAKFTKSFIADDNIYKLYDTLEQVDKIVEDAKKEKDKREEAFNILFGNQSDNGSNEKRTGETP